MMRRNIFRRHGRQYPGRNHQEVFSVPAGHRWPHHALDDPTTCRRFPPTEVENGQRSRSTIKEYIDSPVGEPLALDTAIKGLAEMKRFSLAAGCDDGLPTSCADHPGPDKCRSRKSKAHGRSRARATASMRVEPRQHPETYDHRQQDPVGHERTSGRGRPHQDEARRQPQCMPRPITANQRVLVARSGTHRYVSGLALLPDGSAPQASQRRLPGNPRRLGQNDHTVSSAPTR